MKISLRVSQAIFAAVVLGFPVHGFSPLSSTIAQNTCEGRQRRIPRLHNVYDDWRADASVDTMHLEEENVQFCLQELIDSDYGQQMFGCNERAASIGITGSIEFAELCGPEVTLSLQGAFWHKRSHVLGRAAMWLNARMPEIVDVIVADYDELNDFEEIVDELSGEVILRKDKRSPDYNGDRETMEYQGLVSFNSSQYCKIVFVL